MASPGEAAAPNGISTPPPTTSTTGPSINARAGAASSPSTHTAQNTPSNQNSQSQSQPSTQQGSSVPAHAPTSATDPGTSKRPRDQRILHLVLAGMGVHAYEERVPLMLQDFAYRYQVGVLSDALAIAPDNHLTGAHNPGDKKAAPEPTVSQMAIRQAINSRMTHQFNPTLPKEFLLELAQERNRTALPKVDREFGIRLPHEKYCLTGTGWGLRDGWESEEEIVEGQGDGDVEMGEEEADEAGEFEEVMGVRNDDAMEM